MLKELKLAASISEDFFRACLQEYLNQIDPKNIITVRPFHPDQVNYMKLREEQKDAMTRATIHGAHLINQYSKFSIAVYSGDTLLFVGGVCPLWKNVGEGWLLVSEVFPKFFKESPKVLLKGLKVCFKSMPFQRIQTPVLEGFDQGCRFVELFGFKKEGLMKKYGPDGKSYYRYALVKED